MTDVERYASPEEARALTDRIKAAAEQVWALLLEAHERRVWRALGYDTWEAYVRGEFDMSRQRAYELVNHGKTMRAIAEAAGTDVRDLVQIRDQHTRDIKPILGEVVRDIRTRVAENPDMAQQIVTTAVQRAREFQESERSLREALSRVDADRVRERFRNDLGEDDTSSIIRALTRITEINADPAQAAELFPDWRRHNIDPIIDAVADWVAEFRTAWRSRG